MSGVDAASTIQDGLAPAVDDLSIYLIAGRVRSTTSVVTDAEDAERLGFARVWVSERYSNKEAGVIMGAAAARTSRIGIGTAPIPLGSRPALLTAALGSTLQSAFGPRFTLGVGRSGKEWVAGHGFSEIGYGALLDYVDIIKRLWRGEKVVYDGPAGSISTRMDDIPECPPPPVVYWGVGGLRGCRVAANPLFDGYGFCEGLTPEAVFNGVTAARKECERIGRDPATLRIYAGVVTAPEADEFETLKQIGARILVFLQAPVFGEILCQINGWDPAVMEAIRNHPAFKNIEYADHELQRADAVELAKELVPESYMRAAAAIGSTHECMKKLEEYRDAGADEIAIYAGTPTQNAGLISAWRDRSARGPQEGNVD